jgi:hypothetical protein
VGGMMIGTSWQKDRMVFETGHDKKNQVVWAVVNKPSDFALAGKPLQASGPSGGGGGGGGGGAGADPVPGDAPGGSRTHVVSVLDDPVFTGARLVVDDGVQVSDFRFHSFAPEDRPEGALDVPPGLDLKRWVHIETGVAGVKGEITFDVSIPADEVANPQRGHLLHLVDGVWVPEARLDLTLEGDRYVGSAATGCCSMFALVFDEYAPSVVLESILGPVSGTVMLRAEAYDNLGIAQVEFFVDGRSVAVLH